jgi:type IV pilus assembly protein PilV
MKKLAHTTGNAARGFSLVEVMIAMVVICVGLLGIAKMQSLALSSTNMARMRSLAALEAASLAAAMHANRGYWAGANATATPPPAAITYDPVNGIQGVGAAPPASCNSCTPTQVAAYDLNTWSISLAGMLPGATANIACPPGNPPVNCTITITWVENVVGMTADESAQSAQTPVAALGTFNNPTYTLDVEP